MPQFSLAWRNPKERKPPFRIEVLWFTEESFKYTVDQVWNKVPEYFVAKKIRYFKEDIKL